MPLRPGNPFYFPFSSNDQALIDDKSIVIEDVPYQAASVNESPYPQALRIRFTLKNSNGPAPKLRPLGPGLLWFRADPEPGKAAPLPLEAVSANYSSWPTTGTLILEIPYADVLQRIKYLTGLPIVPNQLWYRKVQLTPNFLFQSLASLRVSSTLSGRGSPAVATNTQQGLQLAISGFLKGRYRAAIIAGTQQSADTLATVTELPTVVAENGSVDLYVTAALNHKPFDGDEKDYENPGATASWDPQHPKYGAIPARLIYRALRAPTAGNMIDAAVGSIVPDRVLASSTVAGVPDYYPVHFTRVWKLIEECSVHFPSQVVHVQHLPPGTMTFDQRLPSHGIVWVALTQTQRLAGTRFRFSISSSAGKPEREMLWLSGDVANPWEDIALTAPVDFDLATAQQVPPIIPHIILRRRMGQEVIYDRRERPYRTDGGGCTYMSMRRTVRALVNNRIAGGRLNFEVFYVRNKTRGRNQATTRALVKDALGAAAATAVLNGQPNHDGVLGPESQKLIVLLESMFTSKVPPQDINGTTPDPQFTYGRAAYHVWQSRVDQFESNATKRAFDPAWIGGGGPGALVALLLAGDYSVNPGQTVVRQPGEAVASYANRIVDDMLSGVLEPGATLQFWDNLSDLTAMRTRTLGTTASGHSPIFFQYAGPAGNPTGIWVLDQDGKPVHCPREGQPGSEKLRWHAFRPDVWIAANWLE
jgi:primosomal replication protein N